LVTEHHAEGKIIDALIHVEHIAESNLAGASRPWLINVANFLGKEFLDYLCTDLGF